MFLLISSNLIAFAMTLNLSLVYYLGRHDFNHHEKNSFCAVKLRYIDAELRAESKLEN
jgi:hypothetical protein